MKKIKELDEEIDNIIYTSERGAGFGGGVGQEEELDRRVQALQRRQGLAIEKRNSWLTLINVVGLKPTFVSPGAITQNYA